MAEENQDEVLEGLWDCPNCSTTNQGLNMTCNSCGAVRTESVEFYLPDDARKIEDAAELSRAKLGPDWLCGYCNTSNIAGSTACKQCGAPAEDGESRKVSEVKDKVAEDDNNLPKDNKSEGGSSKVLMFVGLGLAAFVLLCCILSFVFGGSTTESLAVSDTRWEARVHWEKVSWVRETTKVGERRPSSFDKNIRDVRQTTKTVSESYKEPGFTTKKVNNGNGTFTKKKVKTMVTKTRKVKRTVWEYQRRKWVKQTPRTNRGPPSAKPSFPQVSFSGSSERERRREVAFQVLFKKPKSGDIVIFEGISGVTKDAGDGIAAPKSLEELKNFKVGDKFEVTYSGKSASKVKKL